MWGTRRLWGTRVGVERFEVERQPPERKRGGEEVAVVECALREPDGIDGGEQRGGDRGGRAQQVARQPIDSEQRASRDHAEESARPARHEAREAPPSREQNRGQRRVRVAERGEGDQGAGAEEVPRGRDVIAAL